MVKVKLICGFKEMSFKCLENFLEYLFSNETR